MNESLTTMAQARRGATIASMTDNQIGKWLVRHPIALNPSLWAVFSLRLRKIVDEIELELSRLDDRPD